MYYFKLNYISTYDFTIVHGCHVWQMGCWSQVLSPCWHSPENEDRLVTCKEWKHPYMPWYLPFETYLWNTCNTRPPPDGPMCLLCSSHTLVDFEILSGSRMMCPSTWGNISHLHFFPFSRCNFFQHNTFFCESRVRQALQTPTICQHGLAAKPIGALNLDWHLPKLTQLHAHCWTTRGGY